MQRRYNVYLICNTISVHHERIFAIIVELHSSLPFVVRSKDSLGKVHKHRVHASSSYQLRMT